MITTTIMNLDSKGNLSTVKGFEAPFVGDDAYDRAMDVRNYLAGDTVTFTVTHKGYRIIRNSNRSHCLILDGNAGPDVIDPDHYIAYDYISNGDGFGREVYCSSKTYKSFKGACKKVYSYLH